MSIPARQSRAESTALPATRQIPLEFGHTPLLGEADFFVGEGNSLAYAHLRAYPAWPGPLTLMTGPAASGKSHLARIWAGWAGARLAALDALGELARTNLADPLLIEDVDRIPYVEADLFHLINQSMRDSRPVLMTARDPIALWPYRTEDLRSRARLATLIEVSPDSDTQLSQMFVKLFADRQVAVDPRVIAYLVARMERSPQEAVLLADLIDRAALARGTAITRGLAAEVLAARMAERGGAGYELDPESDTDE